MLVILIYHTPDASQRRQNELIVNAPRNNHLCTFHILRKTAFVRLSFSGKSSVKHILLLIFLLFRNKRKKGRVARLIFCLPLQKLIGVRSGALAFMLVANIYFQIKARRIAKS